MRKPLLVIKDWENGIAESPNKGIALIKNASIDTVQGTVSPQYSPLQRNVVSLSATFTADASTDVCTTVTDISTLITGTAISFSTTGTLPTGLLANTDYFIIKVSSTTFKVASTYSNSQAGTAIDITGAGAGTQTVATINLGTPGSIADDIPNGVTYIADSNQRVWYSEGSTLILLTGNTRTAGSGTGLAHFINSDGSARYLIVYRSLLVDVCNVTTQARRQDPVGTSSWTTAWQALNGGSHQSIVGQDNIIYFCDGRFVGSIQELPGAVFAPGTAATYTFNNQALKLPQGEVANWLDELGINLLVAGGTYNYIYPWDRSSPSFGLPIVCAELGVYRIKNVNNTVVIFNGTRGNIYQTQGALVTLLRKMPEYLVGNGSGNPVAWGGVANKGGAVLFGVQASTGQAGATMSGIYAIWPDGRLVLENQLITAGAAQVQVISRSTSEFYRFAGAGEFDIIDTNRYTNLACIVQSQLYAIADKTQKDTISQIEVQLNQPSNAGSFQLSYRTSLAASFTNIGTVQVAATGVTSFSIDCGLIDIENIQIQVAFSGNASGTDMFQLMEIRLYP